MSRPSKPKPAPAEAPKTEPQAPAPVAAAPDPAADAPQTAPETTGAVSAPASAAAEEPAAPVATTQAEGASLAPANDPDGKAPSPDAPQADASVKGHVVRVIGPAKGRWRAGRKFTPEPVEIPASELTDEAMQKLFGDPELTCLVIGEA